MSDRIAVARVAGRVNVFEPASDAVDAFPFTFDSWRHGATTIRVVRAGRGRQTGSETMTMSATIEVVATGRRAVYPGTPDCGS